jgi:hypothetical protein
MEALSIHEIIAYLVLEDTIPHHIELCHTLDMKWIDYLRDLYEEVLSYEESGVLCKTIKKQ